MILPALRTFLRQRFTRVTSSVAFIPQLDGLRALAIFLVVAYHVFAIYLEDTHRLGTQSLPRDWALIAPRSPLISWVLNLAFGVQIFFAISGFILTIPFARSYLVGAAPPSRRLYLLRRLIRLEPPYFLSMTFLFLMLVIPWHQPWWHARVMFQVFGLHYLASLVYLHGAIYGTPSWINGAAWTLEIEVQFYLLLPVIAELFRIRRNGLRRAIFFAMVTVSALIAQFGPTYFHSARLGMGLAAQVQFFLAGVLLADVYLDPPRILRPGPRVADALALLSAALLVYVLHWRPQLRLMEPFLLMAMFLAIFHGRRASRLFGFPLITFPGTMCYTIYLYHIFMVHQLLPITIGLFPPAHALWWDAGVQLLLMLPPILLVSVVLFLTTERPFMVLSREVTRRFRPKPVPNEVGA